MGKKRRLWMIWGIMLMIIGLVEIQTEAYGQSWNWKFFLSDAECDFYYDPVTVSMSPERIVRVWWKEVFKTKEVLKSRGFTGDEYEKVVSQINVTEINCPRKEWRRKFFMFCSGEGDNTPCAIQREQSDKWVLVMEEQPIGDLYRKLCQ
ncbi:MAG: hypothetical protein ACXWMH_09255 [Syntrophales bacterium]